jgi:alpha-galactosidase
VGPPHPGRRLGPGAADASGTAPAGPAIGRQPAGRDRHQQDPSLFLLRPGTDETAGEGLAISLVYSGNFLAEAEVGPRGATRARIGLQPEGFAWALEPGASFTTPEAVIAWSPDGIG